MLWQRRELILPIKTLAKATSELKNNNLGYSIHSNSKDELGLLCNNFEEMRLILKSEMEARISHERELKELISNISHDVKTPLTAIKGYSEGLLDGIADTEEKQEMYLRTIRNKSDEVASLIDELSTFMLIDCNQIVYNFNRINVLSYFSDFADELECELTIKGAMFDFKPEISENTYFNVDPDKLFRVLSNIVGNSLKYCGSNTPSILIKLHEDDTHVIASLTDNGMGIAAKDLPYIFDRFFRADTSRSSKTGGTGLGLSIAKKIITEHGGTISAVSALSHGTTITIVLPKGE